MKKVQVCFFVLLSMAFGDKLPLIPFPEQVVEKDGVFEVEDSVYIYFNTEDSLIYSWAEMLENEINRTGKFAVFKNVVDFKKTPFVNLSVSGNVTNSETYDLSIDKDSISILGEAYSGLFYGIQTLRQLLSLSDSKISLSAVNIHDFPHYRWRGTHLDVSRRFFSVDFVKKWIETIAMYKINVFHWHLTDDQGWRIEIDEYPGLTDVGAWRNGSSGTYGGFYTKDEIREIVAHAEKFRVNIIPEIEMPGHSQALLAAYPEISCTGGPFNVWNNWGISKEVICAGKDKSYEMMKNILNEVIPLFPFEYVHLGGDECPKDRWRYCDDCQNKINEEGLADEHELQVFFMNEMIAHLRNLGKKAAGWDEIMDGGDVDSALIFAWQGWDRVVHAVRSGYSTIVTPSSDYYFNMKQNSYGEPSGPGEGLTLKDVYMSRIGPEELTVEEKKLIVGGQSCLWTEYIETEEHAEYMMYPRLFALSEILWKDDDYKDYDEFFKRVYKHYGILAEKEVYYRYYPQALFNGVNSAFVFDSTCFENCGDLSGIIAGGGFRPGSDGILWEVTAGDDKSAVVWPFESTENLTIPFWNLTARFYIQGSNLMDSLRMAFNSTNGKKLYYTINSPFKNKNEWDFIKVDLKEWIAEDEFDSASVSSFSLEYPNPEEDNLLVLSDLWLGYADSIPPLKSPLVFFDGLDYSQGFKRVRFYNSHASSGVVEGNGPRPGGNSLLWRQSKDGGKCGLIWQFQAPENLSGIFNRDTLKIKLKGNIPFENLKFRFQDSDRHQCEISPEGNVFNGRWNSLNFPLSEFQGLDEMDFSRVELFKIESDSSQKDMELLISDIWIGSPTDYLVSPVNENISLRNHGGFFLGNNFPNPCEEETIVFFFLSEDGRIKLTLFNLLGEKVIEVLSGNMSEGKHEAVIDCSDLANGIYFYQLKYQGKRLTRKMTVLK